MKIKTYIDYIPVEGMYEFGIAFKYDSILKRLCIIGVIWTKIFELEIYFGRK